MKKNRVTNTEGQYYFKGVRDFSLMAAFSYAVASATGYTGHPLTPLVITGSLIGLAALSQGFNKIFHKINPDAPPQDSNQQPPQSQGDGNDTPQP